MLTEQPRLGRRTRRVGSAVGILAALSISLTPAAAAPPATSTGPSTTTAPYIMPVADDVRIMSLLTVGDSKAAGNGYELVGIPDGLGITKLNGKTVVYLKSRAP